MAVYTGTDAGETLNGSDSADTMFGLGGNDTINAKDGDDTVYGGDGDDVINGQGGNDTLYGGDGNDTINGGQGGDNITGGEGDDILTGGSGGGSSVSKVDTFNYSFNVQAGQSQPLSFSGWSGLDLACVTQNEFSVKYTAWLNYLVATYGLGNDADGDGIVEIGLNQNQEGGTPWIEGMTAEELDAMFSDAEALTVKTGKTTQTRYYSDEFTIGSGTSVTSSDGNDTITDFNTGEDKLNFSGVTAEQFAQYFSWSVVDADNDGVADDTVFTLSTDSSWSLTLIGVTDFDATQDITFA